MIIYPEPDFGNLPAQVAELFAAAARSSFFAQAAWYELVARHARLPQTEVRLCLDAEPPSAGLLLRTDGPRRLHGLSNAYSVEHGPILGVEGAAANALRRLVEELALEEKRQDSIRLAALDPADPGYGVTLDALRSAGWVVRPFFDSGTWYEDTRGLEFRRYLQNRPAVLRNTFRRKAKAAGDAGIAYAFAVPGCDIEGMIEDYETVYRASWKEREAFPDFMPHLIRLAFRLGALRMGVIRIDGTPAAAQFWIIWQGRAVIYKLAHDERFAKLSLGTLLTMRLMERVLEFDRPLEVNFGRGDDPYKKLWLPRRRERWGLYAANPRTMRGATLGLRMIGGAVRDRVTGRAQSPAADPHQ